MHEFSIARSLLDVVLEAAAEYEGARIKVIRLRIGELRQVIEFSLVEAFALCAAGTAAEGAELEIEWVPTVWRCSACGRTRSLAESDAGCSCGNPEATDRMEGCDDLLLTSLDLDEA